jgi:hypothetical protein
MSTDGSEGGWSGDGDEPGLLDTDVTTLLQNPDLLDGMYAELKRLKNEVELHDAKDRVHKTELRLAQKSIGAWLVFLFFFFFFFFFHPPTVRFFFTPFGPPLFTTETEKQRCSAQADECSRLRAALGDALAALEDARAAGAATAAELAASEARADRAEAERGAAGEQYRAVAGQAAAARDELGRVNVKLAEAERRLAVRDGKRAEQEAEGECPEINSIQKWEKKKKKTFFRVISHILLVPFCNPD